MKGSNNHKKNPLIAKNLSHREVLERLDLYSQADQEQFFKIQKIKKSYEEEVKNRENKRVQSDIFHQQGWRNGVHPNASNQIQNDREIQDQILRNNVVKEGKGEYRLHNSHTKQFNQSDKITELNKDLSKVRDIKQKTKDSIKELKSNPANIPSKDTIKSISSNIKNLNLNRLKLSQQFDQSKSLSKELGRTFEDVSKKEIERDI